jgi:thermostable 8-oxoguanine DNA glycosylase
MNKIEQLHLDFTSKTDPMNEIEPILKDLAEEFGLKISKLDKDSWIITKSTK